MEEWKDIVGFEGLYQVSDYGNVRSVRSGKLLKPFKKDSKNCYLKVWLCKEGKQKTKFVHRLVAEAFIPNPHHLPEVNHKSECPALNVACLLEWTTHKENTNYGTRNQRISDTKSIAINQCDRDGNFIRQWKSAMEVERQLGIRHQNISLCLKGRLKTAGGYGWQYATEL